MVAMEFDESNELNNTMVPILHPGQKRPNQETEWISVNQLDDTRALGRYFQHLTKYNYIISSFEKITRFDF